MDNKKSGIIAKHEIHADIFQVSSESLNNSDKLFLEQSQEELPNCLEPGNMLHKTTSDINDCDDQSTINNSMLAAETKNQDLILSSSYNHTNETPEDGILNTDLSNHQSLSSPNDQLCHHKEFVCNPENNIQQCDNKIADVQNDLQQTQCRNNSNEEASDIIIENCTSSNDNASLKTDSSDFCRTTSTETFASSSSLTSSLSAGSGLSKLNLMNISPKNDNGITSSELSSMNNASIELNNLNMHNEVESTDYDRCELSNRKRRITCDTARKQSCKVKCLVSSLDNDFQINDFSNAVIDIGISGISSEHELDDSHNNLQQNGINDIKTSINSSISDVESARPSLSKDDSDMINCSNSSTSNLENKCDSIFLIMPDMRNDNNSPDQIPTYDLMCRLDEHNDIVSLTITRTDRKYLDYNADWSQNSSPSSVTSTGIYQLADQKRYSTMSSSTTSSGCSTKTTDNFAIPAIPLKKSTIHKQDIKGQKDLFRIVKDIFKINPDMVDIDDMNLYTESSYGKSMESTIKTSEKVQKIIKDAHPLNANLDNQYEVINSPELIEENISYSDTNGRPMTPRTKHIRKAIRTRPASPRMRPVIQEEVSASDPRTNCRVLARWVDKKYYAGRIVQVKDSNKFVIRFDDNHTKTLIDEFIIFGEEDVLPLQGQSIYVSPNGDLEYEPGIVISIIPSKEEVFYNVETDNSAIISATASDFYLTEDQARAIKEIQAVEAEVDSTKRRAVRDLSLDNIIQGPRSRRQINAKPSTPKAGSSGLNKKRNASRNKRHISESSDKSITEPTSPASTPENEENSGKTHIEEVQGVEPEVQKTPKKIPGALTGPFPVKGCGRLSGRRTSKVVGNLYDNSDPEIVELLGPIPEFKSLFNSKHFLLTCTEDIPHRTKLNWSASYDANSGTDSEYSTDTESCKVPFVKERLKCQLEAGGGIVYSHFEEVPQNKYRHCVLIAPRPCHTAKYIQCLATNIKAVLHSWVIDCCKSNKLLAEYDLPAGWSIERKCYIRYETGKELYMRLSSNPFNDFLILLCSDNNNFLKFWGRVCKQAGASIKTIDNDDIDVSVGSVIVTDSDCPLKIRKQAQSLEIPLVSTTWVVQSLIIGQVCNYDNNIRYAYNYIDTD